MHYIMIHRTQLRGEGSDPSIRKLLLSHLLELALNRTEPIRLKGGKPYIS